MTNQTWYNNIYVCVYPLTIKLKPRVLNSRVALDGAWRVGDLTVATGSRRCQISAQSKVGKCKTGEGFFLKSRFDYV